MNHTHELPEQRPTDVFALFETDPERYAETRELLGKFRQLVLVNCDAEDAEDILDALKLSMRLHAGQEDRFDGPYVNHILRVTIRLMEEFKKKSKLEIIAALFHDTIEDRPAELVKEVSGRDISELGAVEQWKQGLNTLLERYGSQVRRTVRLVTNRPKIAERIIIPTALTEAPRGASKEDEDLEKKRHIDYAVHVARAIEDGSAAVLKASDFSDNALRTADEDVDAILAIKDEKKKRKKIAKTVKLMKKYLPTIAVFKQRLRRGDIANVETFVQKLSDSRTHMKEKLQQLMRDQDPTFDSETYEQSMLTKIDEEILRRKTRGIKRRPDTP